jgi:hypothetical protein
MHDSERLYQEIKMFFGTDLRDQIIEISDAPMDEWLVHYDNSEEEMCTIRGNLASHSLPFAAFCPSDDNQFREYFYTDNCITMAEDYLTGRICYYSDHTFSEFDLGKLRNELKELMKISQ